ncbi:PTS glucose transporter subunit IIB [Metamycoplasma gateae]|uniref:PTS glucose transporter subunit IIB n=1 Tax=Metamycoplasma gateae TaxID=35769 RepID=A0ABZ2ALS4_9BACT|nr:PTS glucose transporter subunit IIB [Metamycoplasma gateae]
MNKKNKFLYFFLIVITFGFILIYWQKKYRQSKIKNYLTKETNLSFDFKQLIEYLGGNQNIERVSSTQKVLKISFYDKEKIDLIKLKKLDGVTGITVQSKSISLVVGNTAKYIDELINEAK